MNHLSLGEQGTHKYIGCRPFLKPLFVFNALKIVLYQ